MSLFDLQGKMVYTSALHDKYSSHEVSGLAGGVYLLQLVGKENTSTRKLVVTK